MKIYKSSEDTLCIQGKEIKKFEIETSYKGKELVDSELNGIYDTMILGYRFPGMEVSKHMFYGNKLSITTLFCSMTENMLLYNIITEDELKEAISLVIKQIRKSEKNAGKDNK